MAGGIKWMDAKRLYYEGEGLTVRLDRSLFPVPISFASLCPTAGGSFDVELWAARPAGCPHDFCQVIGSPREVRQPEPARRRALPCVRVCVCVVTRGAHARRCSPGRA